MYTELFRDIADRIWMCTVGPQVGFDKLQKRSYKNVFNYILFPHYQNYSLNICKDQKIQLHPLRINGQVFLCLWHKQSSLPWLHLSTAYIGRSLTSASVAPWKPFVAYVPQSVSDSPDNTAPFSANN